MRPESEIDIYETETMKEVLAIKQQIADEVAHLPLGEALAEIVRRASVASEKRGLTETYDVERGGRTMPLVRKPTEAEGTE